MVVAIRRSAFLPMARAPTGQVIRRPGGRGCTYALRFRAYGRRRYLTLGSADQGWTEARARVELANILADVRRGLWRPLETHPVAEAPTTEPTFHEFASEWMAMREQERLAARTIEDYTWCLSNHLLPFFKDHLLSEITVREVDRYKTGKAVEGSLSPNRINKTQVAHRKDLADLKLWHCLNSASEAQVLARFIKKLHTDRAAKGFRYSDVAVLLRIIRQAPQLIAFELREWRNVIVKTGNQNSSNLVMHLRQQTHISPAIHTIRMRVTITGSRRPA